MRIHIHPKIQNSLHRVVVLAAFALVISLPFYVPATVSAETKPNGTADTLKAYCKTQASKAKLTKDAQKGCEVTDNLNSTINVAGYYCTDMSAAKKTSATRGPGTDRSNCIESKSEEFIRKIIKAKPKTKAAFTLGLADYLTRTGHSLTTPAEGAGDGVYGNSTYNAGAQNCDSLNGTCADCNNLDENGNAPDNCVGCSKGLCHDAAADPNTTCGKNNCNLLTKYINPLINLLSVSFGLLAIISIILGGVQYATSEGDPQKVSKAKDRIAKTIFAIVGYFFLYALLQFLIPGGLFTT